LLSILLIVFCMICLYSEAARTKPATPFYQAVVKRIVWVQGRRRPYFVYRPALLESKSESALPVLLVLHGASAKGPQIMQYTRMNAFAEKKGFLAVYPQRDTFLDWDLKNGNQSRDVPYIQAVIADLKQVYPVDSKRIYATGYSSGGELAEILACTLPDQFAAFASIESNMRQRYAATCQTIAPVSMLMVNGTRDHLDPWEGDGKDLMSIPDSIRFWRNHNRCQGPEETIHLAPQAASSLPSKFAHDATRGVLFQSGECDENSTVSLVKIIGGGHTWAGTTAYPSIPPPPLAGLILGPTSHNVDVNEVIWNFFEQHPRPL
jgi:polyhydroxybutyrate depolymerase